MIIAKDRTHHTSEVTFTAIGNRFLISVVDVTARKKAEEKLYALSITDPLTGFYNRRHFDAMLTQECHRAHRYGQPLTLIIFDVDFFKGINDEYGHPAGDEVLRTLAETAGTTFREADSLFRIGGEEFAALLPATGGTWPGWRGNDIERRWKIQLPDTGAMRWPSPSASASPPEKRIRRIPPSSSKRRTAPSTGRNSRAATAPKRPIDGLVLIRSHRPS